MAIPPSDLFPPPVSAETLTSNASLEKESGYNEEDWLSSSQELIAKEKPSPREFVSWAAYRASQTSLSSHQPAIISLLPMFVENAHSLAMIAHSMSVVNPSQTPVIALDQPLIRPGQANSMVN